MSKIKAFFIKIGQSLYKTIRRFPHSILLAALIGVVCIVKNHADLSVNIYEILDRVALSFLFAIPLSLSTQLLLEMEMKKLGWQKIISWILASIASIFCYFIILRDLNHQVYIVRFVAITLGTTVLFTIITFLKGRKNPEVYAQKLGWRLIITMIYNWIIVGGIVAILFAIENLLQINVSEELYFDVVIFIPTFIMPAFFLAGIPRVEEAIGEQISKLFKVLLMYVLMPILIAYTMVLYTYFVKLLVDGEWPENMLGNLVLWYGLISVVVLYLANPTKKDNAWSKFFYRVYPYLLITPIVMMFVSFGIRIQSYGVTEGRYMALAAGLWTLVCAILFFWNDMSRKIKVVPLALSIIAIISVVGPWSAFSVSKYSQNLRFENILLKNDMLVKGKIVPSDTISKKDIREIASVLDYFDENHDLTDLRYLPDDFNTDLSESLLGFAYEPDNRYNSERSDVYIYNETNDMLYIQGYDYYLSRNDTSKVVVDERGKLEVYCDENNCFRVVINSIEVYEKDLDEVVKVIIKKHPEDTSLSREELTFEDENDRVKVKIVFSHISYQIEEEKTNVAYAYLIQIK